MYDFDSVLQALIWDLSHMPKPTEDPILAYYAVSPLASSSFLALMPLEFRRNFASPAAAFAAAFAAASRTSTRY